MPLYRIMNRVTREWWEGSAASAQEACKEAGWMIGDCWVRERTPLYGWKKPGEIQPQETEIEKEAKG